MTDASLEPAAATGDGQLVSLYYLKSELRRRRRVWLSTGLAGLVLGAGLHFLVPWSASATTVVVLAHDPSQDPQIAMATDVVEATTLPVAAGAVNQLGLPVLPQDFVKKYSAVSLTPGLLKITVRAASPAEAVRDANAVTTSFLTFRADQLTSQDNAVIDTLRTQASALQATIAKLNTEINQQPTSGTSSTDKTDLTNAIATRAAASAQQDQLEAQIQTDLLNTNSINGGSHVINTAVAAPPSHLKHSITNAITGLIAGLGLGVFAVIIAALLSDRLRRRDDIAAALGVPVEVSVGRLPRWRRSRRTTMLEPAATYVAKAVEEGATTTSCIVVAIDDVATSSRVVLSAAERVAAGGQAVTLVDLTASGELQARYEHSGRALAETDDDDPVGTIELVRPSDRNAALGSPLSQLAGGENRSEAAGDSPTELTAEELTTDELVTDGRPTVVVLALADSEVVDGTGQFATTIHDAIVVANAGRSSGTRLHALSRALRHGGLFVEGAILLDADREDESSGLLDASSAEVMRVRLVGLANK